MTDLCREEQNPENFTDRVNFLPDCGKCCGLCCVALYFSTSEGFPADKAAGRPCPYLQADFRCQIHKDLGKKGLKGCMAFDCLGAGQKVTQVTFAGHDWRRETRTADKMFEVFLIMRQLQQLLWYLTDALTYPAARCLRGEVGAKRDEVEKLTRLQADLLMNLEMDSCWKEVDILLTRVSELVRADGFRSGSIRKKSIGPRACLIGADLRNTSLMGVNLRGACLIAAHLQNADLGFADLIGADLRDADIRGADLSGSIFLTQFQINSAKGDMHTKLPASIRRPANWVK